MKFYGKGVVWDGENNKRLIKFVGGVCDTDDKRIQAILIERGYPCDPELPVVNIPTVRIDDGEPIPESVTTTNVPEGAPPVTADMNVKKLREIGREYGLSFTPGTKKTEMAEQINEAMNGSQG